MRKSIESSRGEEVVRSIKSGKRQETREHDQFEFEFPLKPNLSGSCCHATHAIKSLAYKELMANCPASISSRCL
jgi:hypothetical protein